MKFIPYHCGPFPHHKHSIDMGIGTVFSSQIYFKTSTIQAGESCLVHNTDDLSLIPRAHVEVEEENQFHRAALRLPHVLCGMHAPPPHHTHTQTRIHVKFSILQRLALLMVIVHSVRFPSLPFPSIFYSSTHSSRT